jgi:hypothetical protein
VIGHDSKEENTMSRRNTKRLLWWGMLGVLVVAATLGVWATHGFLWSIYVPIYDRLLYNLPSPPGLLPETDEIDLNPEAPWGYRRYRVPVPVGTLWKPMVGALNAN